MRALRWFRNLFPPYHTASVDGRRREWKLARLIKIGERTMTAISDFAAAHKAFSARQAAALEALAGDVKALNDKLTAIQNSPGTLSAEDQALLDEALATTEALTTKFEALDSETPPTPPVA